MPILIRPTIAAIFLARVQATPNLIGFLHRPGGSGAWERLTYREFHDQCRLVSFGLMSLGATRGTRVAILSRTRLEWSLCDVAIMGAGAVSVPLHAQLNAPEIAELLEHSEAKHIIVEDGAQLQKLLTFRSANPDRLRQLRGIIVMDPAAIKLAVNATANVRDVLTLQAVRELGRREESRAPGRFEENLQAIAPEDWLTICYTTGTTGTPKGVPLTHRNFASVIEDCVDRMRGRIRPEAESCVSFLPFAHVLGRLESMIVHSVGIRQAFADDLDGLPALLEELKPTLLFAVPRVFEKAYGLIQARMDQWPERHRRIFAVAFRIGREYFETLRAGRKPPLLLEGRYRLLRKLVFQKVLDRFGGQLRYAISGGAPLNPVVGEFFHICGVPILEGYGLTETSAPVTLSDPDHPRYGSVGKPLREVSLKIADDGEILVKSAKVFAGYYKDEAATRAALQDGWLHTGDIGTIDDDGYLFVTDRKKDLIITSAGKNIAPQKIEKLAKAQKPIAEIIVHGDRRNFLTALLTLHRDQVLQYANDHHMLFSEYSELIRQPRIRGWVERAVESVNEQLPSYETIRKFIILPTDFSIEAGELTPSLKVKRRVVEARYRDQLDQLYGAAP